MSKETDTNKMAVNEQLTLFKKPQKIFKAENTLDKVVELLQSDLDFHNQASNKNSHTLHSFPAKFPPQLPMLFISELTDFDDVVLDPMAGSGTTLLEAYLANRKSIGYDIDPLAIKIIRAKITPLNKALVRKYAERIYFRAKNEFIQNKENLTKKLNERFDAKTKQFLDYWFLPVTQLELMALIEQINELEDDEYRNFFEVIFSSIIITKSGGVSLALDLGHTRPHRIKSLLNSNGEIIWGKENYDISKKQFSTKILRNSFEEFRKKIDQSIYKIFQRPIGPKPDIRYGNSQDLSLDDESVDLIITSPPYASNAIDYMRAHKFSLIWFGYTIDELTKKRNEYIGAEATSTFGFEDLPEFTLQKVNEVAKEDINRGKVLKRYYSEMKKSISEMYRVLKPGKVAIVVVGNSIMKGIDTETPKCLQEIGRSVGFISPYVGIRRLDRNKRMLPTGKEKEQQSQIQQRMHEEYVIGFYKSY